MHLTASPVDWYAARAAGIAAYVALTLVLALGLSLSGKAVNERWPRFAVEDVHRFGGLLVGWLIGIHVLTIAIDSYLPFSLTQLVVPFTSRYRPLWTGLGIAAAELLLALAITNHYRRRVPHRFWRRAHYLNFAVWGVATLHGIGAGTDRSAPWLALLYGASTALVLGLLVWRTGLAPLRSGAAGTVALTAAVVPIVLVLGPFRHNPRGADLASFNEQLTGRIVRSGVPQEAIVSMKGSAGNDQKLLVRADLLAGQGQLDATSLQVEYVPSGTMCRGQVTSVAPEAFAGDCALPTGERRHFEASWSIAEDGSLVGTISSTRA